LRLFKYIRATFLVEKTLAKRLDKLSKSKRGFKTLFINQAISALLDELEKNKKRADWFNLSFSPQLVSQERSSDDNKKNEQYND
jgi:hypothetical protein